MKNYYRLSLGESLFDGESWSINQWYEQPYIVEVDENSDCNAIIKSLKTGGLLKKNLRYNGFYLDFSYDENEIYIERYYSNNSEPLMIKLSIIDENRLESELNSHYGIGRLPTTLCKA